MNYEIWYNKEIKPFIKQIRQNVSPLELYALFVTYPQKSGVQSHSYFNTHSTGSDRHDRDIALGKAYLSVMTPMEYMLRCGLQIRRTSLLQWFDGSLKSFTPHSTVDSIINGMQKGIKFDTPYIDYRIPTQDGRHRAMASWYLGVEKIPVWVFQ